MVGFCCGCGVFGGVFGFGGAGGLGGRRREFSGGRCVLFGNTLVYLKPLLSLKPVQQYPAQALVEILFYSLHDFLQDVSVGGPWAAFGGFGGGVVGEDGGDWVGVREGH